MPHQTADGTQEAAEPTALARIEPVSKIVNVAAPIVDRLDKLTVGEGDVVKTDPAEVF